MSREWAILITLVSYKLVLIAIGFWASRRTHSNQDFFIGGKSLGPWVAAVSSSASASSAWSLLGVSGAAYFMGLPALLLFPAVVGGYVFNWLWLAPRIRKAGNRSGAITLTELLADDPVWQKRIALVCGATIVFSFTFYIAAQFQAAGGTFSSSFGMSTEAAVITGTLIILFYTLLGGFWAVSVTDTLQGILMAAAAILIPAAALIEVGGFSVLLTSLNNELSAEQLSLSDSYTGLMGVAFIVGMLGIGLGNPGQPHVVNRFMAIGTERDLRIARIIGIAWPTIVYGGMLLLGYSARLLVPESSNHEQVLFSVTNLLFSPIVAGIIIAAVLSAIMSTADSQLLVSASSLSYDLQFQKQGQQTNTLLWSRITVALMCLISASIALLAPEAIFSRVLFAWAALGAAFGPLLIVLLLAGNVRGSHRFYSVLVGFSLTVLLNWFSESPGAILERVLPFAIAFAIAWFGRERRTN